MTRKTLTTIAAASLVALGGMAIGAGPAHAASCPPGHHLVQLGAMGRACAANTSGGIGSGSGTFTVIGGHTPSTGRAPKAPVYTPPKTNYVTATKVGSVLKADKSGWAKGTVLKYRWTRNGVTIAGATASTYEVRSADKRKTVSVVVTGKKSGHTSSKTGKKFFVG
ncbi:MAG: hypothetical protein JWN19_2870 [Arthrobacter sp.]|jgi:hypothetical protein|nr:hypothetical protein [Arthrobacter sp.]